MKPLSVKELEQLLRTEPFKFISLVDSDGTTIVAYNNPRIKVDVRKKEILAKLKSTILPDGLYYLQYKDQLENSGMKKYAVAKGRVNMNQISETPVKEKVVEKTVAVMSENVLSYESALAMQKEIADLKAEVKSLQRERDELLEELEDEEGMGDSEEQGSFMKELFEKAVPLVDKYFANREREVAAMEELAAKRTVTPATYNPKAAPPRPAATQPQQPAQPQTTIITPSYGAPTQSTGTATPPGELDSTEIENQLVQMSNEDLMEIYEGLKKSGKLDDLKIFIRALKATRPEDLKQIVKADM